MSSTLSGSAVQAARILFMTTIGDVIRFPIWWYTKGLVLMAGNRLRAINDMADNLALRLLLVNMFRPMFAQYDMAGRAISFFLRIVLLIGRVLYLAVFAILQTALLLLWVALPIAIVIRLLMLFSISYAGG